MSKIPDISIVIPTYGRPDLVVAAVQSVLAQAFDGSFDVQVVDDGGQDATGAALKALGDARLHYHWISHGGPASARNHGVGQSQSPFIAFLDSDTLAQPGWLQAGYDALKAQPALLGIEGRVERAQLYPATPFTEAVENLEGGRWLTCNVFIRREGFLALGGFDQRFTEPCREDSEFAFRAEAAGLALGFAPEALVRHPVREVGPWRQIHHAREGRFEALIERQHPQAYRRHFKWLDGRQMPVYYGAHYLALLLAPFSLLLAALCLGLGATGVLYAWCRKRRVAWQDPLRLLLPALLAPYLRLAWVAWGYLSYPQGPDKTSMETGEAAGFDTGSILAVIVVAALYLFSRTPFYTQPLIGEEGTVAQVLAASPAGPNYLLAARVNGANIYQAPMHPGPLYAVYAGLGWVLRGLGRIGGSAGPTDLWARMAQSCFEGVLWLCLAWRFGRSPQRVLLLGLLLLGLSSPLGVSASIYLQTDTSSGLLLCGLLGLALAEAENFAWPVLALFGLAAMGKQEWSVAALLALACSQAWASLQGLPRPGGGRRMAGLGLAFMAGHLCNFAFDPLNYRGGLTVLHSVTVAQSASWTSRWMSLWPARQPFVLSLLAMLLPSALLALTASLERRARELDACALAWALFLAFLLSAWNYSPRYFAPAWGAGLSCFASQLAARRPGVKLRMAASLALMGLALWQALFLEGIWMRQLSLTEFTFSQTPLVVQQEDAAAAASSHDCVDRFSTGYAWNRPLDFVGSGYGAEDALALTQAHGKPLCQKAPAR